MNAVRLPTTKKLIVALLILSLVFTFNMGFAKQVFGGESQGFTIQSNEGRIWTTDESGEAQDGNQYLSAGAVYINGEGFESGPLWIKVTTTNNKLLGVSTGAVITVNPDGTFANQPINLWENLVKPNGGTGFDEHDGVHKVWVSTSNEFKNNESKTDNFSIVSNDPEYGSIKITKYQDGTLTKDILFKLFNSLDSNREPIRMGETKSDGTLTFIGLNAGTYYLSEDVPNGYDTDLNENVGVVVTAGQETPIIVNNTHTHGSITITKYQDGSLKDGITFKLYDTLAQERSVIRTGATTTDGTLIFDDLDEGTYYLTEDVPEGYDTDLTENKEVRVAAGAATPVVVHNTVKTTHTHGSITITKYQDDSLKEGITFNLYDTLAQERSIIRTGVTTTDGTLTFDDLDEGTYYLTEDVPEGYDTDLTENKEVRVAAGAAATVVVHNTSQTNSTTGSIKIIKTKNVSGNISPHSGVTFKLRPVPKEEVQPTILAQENNELTFPLSGTTNAEGILTFGSLAPGDYLLEEEVPANYSTDAPNTVTVELGEVTEVDVVNTYTGGSNHHHHDDGDDDEEETVVIPEEEPVVAPPTEEPVEEIEESVAVIVPEEPKVTAPQLPKTGGDPMSFVIFGSALSALGIYLRRRS